MNYFLIFLFLLQLTGAIYIFKLMGLVKRFLAVWAVAAMGLTSLMAAMARLAQVVGQVDQVSPTWSGLNATLIMASPFQMGVVIILGGVIFSGMVTSVALPILMVVNRAIN